MIVSVCGDHCNFKGPPARRTCMEYTPCCISSVSYGLRGSLNSASGHVIEKHCSAVKD